MTKLRRDVGVVQQNCRVLSEMLTEVTSGNENAADKELLKVHVAPINTYTYHDSQESGSFFLLF